MLKIEPHSELHNKVILLYGGEPFLKENKSIVCYIVQKGYELGYKFKVITNGYDLDAYEDILSTDYFVSFQITLDGFREYHNARRRHYQKGGDTFDQIISNISLLLKHGIDTTVRINVDANNLKDIDALVALFREMGLMDNPLFKLAPSPVAEFKHNAVRCKGIKYLGNKEYLAKIGEKMDELNYHNDLGIYRKFCNYFKNHTSCKLTSTICPAQYGTYMFDPVGDIYTCLEVVGKKEYSIGNYNADVPQWTEIRERWFSQNAGNIPECMACKFALLCGGKCLAKTTFVRDDFSSWCTNYPMLFIKSVNKAYNAVFYY